jgi:lipopolysaccharide transport system ATP-binding protein
MSSEVTIKVENLSKSYLIYGKPQDRLKQFILPRFQKALSIVGVEKKNYYQEFYALQNISFEIKKGETVGVIGRNGSGKSTLLQIICGTLTPTTGTVQTNGRVAALLELGSGFNHNFTGRENVYINGTILGLSREEIDARFDKIASFADIGKFIDQPVKTYSSGMVVRLAFAVQAQVDPDILIVDEALSVGDVKFQAKCFDFLKKLKDNGTSILLVTHSTEQIVTHCTRAFLLDNGVQIETGDPKYVANRYLDLLFGKEQVELSKTSTAVNQVESAGTKEESNIVLDYSGDSFSTRLGYNKYEYRWGDGAASILDYYLEVEGTAYPSSIKSGQKVRLVISVRFHRDLVRPILGIIIKTKEGLTVSATNSEMLNNSNIQSLGDRQYVAQVEINFVCRLAPGHYFISLGISTKQGEDVIPHDRRYDAIVFAVLPTKDFFGLTDLEIMFHTVKTFAKG